MFPGYVSKRGDLPQMNASENRTTQKGFFNGTTKDINVLENRFMQDTINIANDPSDVEKRL